MSTSLRQLLRNLGRRLWPPALFRLYPQSSVSISKGNVRVLPNLAIRGTNVQRILPLSVGFGCKAEPTLEAASQVTLIGETALKRDVSQWYSRLSE